MKHFLHPAWIDKYMQVQKNNCTLNLICIKKFLYYADFISYKYFIFSTYFIFNFYIMFKTIQ